MPFSVGCVAPVSIAIPMHINEFDFHLPTELIAQFPAERRTDSRLLRLDGNSGALTDAYFTDLPDYLVAGDVLVFNDTRVIKARLFGKKDSGGRVELLVERLLDDRRALVHIRASHAPKAETSLTLDGGARLAVLDREGDLFRVQAEGEEDLLTLLDRHGRLPLPPYIEREPESADESRYQTVYARHPGAVAAPTAGLHFDQPMLDRLTAMGVETAFVTLHVGAGTFQPVRVENVAEHKMHGELYQIPATTAETVNRARAEGRRVMAVGTTSLRALEAAGAGGELTAGAGETNLFIVPGYCFRIVDRLLTNFHLPKSTLLMLISAFGGIDNIRGAYQHAVEARYRFFSYGDAMLIERQK